jgi:transcriptional regulator with XRE-family HTH domain
MNKQLQKNVAKKVGISPAFISMIMSGQRRPSWNKAKKLAEATGTKVDLWMEGSPDEIRAAVFEVA